MFSKSFFITYAEGYWENIFKNISACVLRIFFGLLKLMKFIPHLKYIFSRGERTVQPHYWNRIKMIHVVFWWSPSFHPYQRFLPAQVCTPKPFQFRLAKLAKVTLFKLVKLIKLSVDKEHPCQQLTQQGGQDHHNQKLDGENHLRYW